jgi:hypothetical protein
MNMIKLQIYKQLCRPKTNLKNESDKNNRKIFLVVYLYENKTYFRRPDNEDLT